MELDVTLMFADLRGFTKMSDSRLPYDVVFILNQYFELMGQAIESKDGYLDKFIGDGIMAIFGIKSGPQIGAKQAIGAAIEMSRKLEVLNDRLSEEVSEPLRINWFTSREGKLLGQWATRNHLCYRHWQHSKYSCPVRGNLEATRC